jgi:hypothetical protein
VVSSWSDPGTKIERGQYKKVLCMALVQNEANRRVAEDKLASLMPGRAVQSYTWFNVLPDSIDKQRTGDALRASGFDGVLIMRLVRKEKDVTYVPGSYPAPYYSAYGYYGYSHPYYADPGYVRTDDYYYIETNLYDLTKDKLLWSGMTSTWEPSSVESAVEGVVNAVVQKMRDEGFLTAPAQ